MAPPSKRRKTAAVPDSDDEADNPRPQANTLSNFLFSSPNSKASSSRGPTASPSPVKSKSQPARVSTRGGRKNDTRSPSASPEKKPRAGKRGKAEEKGKSGDLVALFSKQAQKAPLSSFDGANRAPSSRSGKVLDDIVSDPISDDDGVAESKASTASFVGQNARKRARDGATSNGIASSSSKFLRPSAPERPAVSLDDDLRPWSERFAPINLDELAVHKKKVADVRRWLQDVIDGRLRQRLLLLKGAAGSGKTTTMRLLAKDMGCEILEWKNPNGAAGATLGYSSASAQFEEFLGRGGKFGQLDVDDSTDSSEQQSSHQAAISSQQPGGNAASRKRIILVEEFPNTFARSSSALTSFRNTVLGYLAANTPSLAALSQRTHGSELVVPVVMIISETLLTTTSASADSFTAHRLLGPEILRHPGTGLIEFNAIAPSILSKALDLVVVKEARKSGRRRTPGPHVLKRLGEIGDIRSAISSLEFLCLKGDNDADWGAKIAFTKPKKSVRDGIALTKNEAESLEMISQREASLGIFHAVGKVVYNKRDELPPRDDTVENTLPHYLAQYARPKRSQVAIDALIDEIGTDTHTFVSALHENYALSCEGNAPMEHVNGCLDYLSASDLLCPSWDVFFGNRGVTGGSGGTGFIGKDSASHVLRQDEITFQVAVRGMLFSLPSPVKRKSHPGGGGGSSRGVGGSADAYKMFYPTSIKLWRTKEELEGLVDVWSAKLLKGEENAPTKQITDGAAAFRRPKKIGGSGGWLANRQQQQPQFQFQSRNSTAATDSSHHELRSKDGENGDTAEEQSKTPPPLLSLGSAARREMLLERLPYMAIMARAGRVGHGSGPFASASSTSTHQQSDLRLRDLERVVSFQGIGPQQGGAGDDESGDEAVEEALGPMAAGEQWATDKPSDEPSPRKKAVAGIRPPAMGTATARSDRTSSGVSGLGVHALAIDDGDDIKDDDIED